MCLDGSVPTSRAENRAQLTHAILERARDQLGEVGPAALSVRQIARELGVSSSATYRYFPTRDALLTALIIDAYDELADAVEDAGQAESDSIRARWRALCHAVRDWARAHPHRYALVYGTPVPGYAAPDDTVPAAARVTLAVLTLARDAELAGAVPVAIEPVPGGVRDSLAPVRGFVDPPLGDAMTVRAVACWATLLGAISLELFGHLHRGVLDYDTHFAHLVDQLAADLGLVS